MIVMVVVLALVTLLVYFVRYGGGTLPVEPTPDSPALVAARREVDEIERLAMGIVDEPVPVKRLVPSGPGYEQYKKRRDARYMYMPAAEVATFQDPNNVKLSWPACEIRPIRRSAPRTSSTGAK